MKDDNCNSSSSSSSSRSKQEQKLVNVFSGHARKMSSSKWIFSVCASSSSRRSTCNIGTDTIGTIDFDESNELMATGGIARRVRVYSLASILPPEAGTGTEITTTFDTESSAVSVICMPARLSSLQWKLGQAGVIGCGDYDGVVAEWDVERRVALTERDGHDGRHVWSVNYCSDGSGLCLSASDDGTAKVWAPGVEGGSVGVISAPRRTPVCCAQFSPSSRNVLALACADSNVYLHDLRRPDCAVSTLADHHRRPVSYVRFLAEDRLLSASVDSTIKLWDVSSAVDPVVLQTFRGHRNVKNFVGLSVWSEGGLVACGSETNQAFVYEVGGGRDHPILRHDLYAAAAAAPPPPCLSSSSGSRLEQDRSGGAALVSAVCWRRKPFECTLAAANSDGLLQLISGQPPP